MCALLTTRLQVGLTQGGLMKHVYVVSVPLRGTETSARTEISCWSQIIETTETAQTDIFESAAAQPVDGEAGYAR